MGLVLPHHCFACHRTSDAALCCRCRTQLERLDPAGRCSTCFGDEDLIDQSLCAECLNLPLYHRRTAAVLAYEGVGGALAGAMRKEGCAYLARGCGALMLLQFDVLGWETPDVVVPVPIPPLRRWLRGYSPSHLLGMALSKLLGVPCVNALGCRFGSSFYSRRVSKGWRVLLVDDVLTTGSLVSHCAMQLVGAGAISVDVLALCRATW